MFRVDGCRHSSSKPAQKIVDLRQDQGKTRESLGTSSLAPNASPRQRGRLDWVTVLCVTAETFSDLNEFIDLLRHHRMWVHVKPAAMGILNTYSSCQKSPLSAQPLVSRFFLVGYFTYLPHSNMYQQRDLQFPHIHFVLLTTRQASAKLAITGVSAGRENKATTVKIDYHHTSADLHDQGSTNGNLRRYDPCPVT